MDQKWVHPTGFQPETVCINALGGSSIQWTHHLLRKGTSQLPEPDECWAINRGLRCWPSDMAFVMDDLRREAAQDPEYGEAIKSYALEHPVITSEWYPEFDTLPAEDRPVRLLGPGIHEYPLGEVAAMLTNPGTCYLMNSIPMALAYAELIGVKRIILVGADYTLPSGQVMEWGRSNVEYMLGRLEAKGIAVHLPGDTTLMTGPHGRDYVYGFDHQYVAHQRIRAGLDAARAASAEVMHLPIPG